jgi:hypothetical protein
MVNNMMTVFLASSSEEGGALLAPLIIPVLVFIAVYFFIYRYYRNTDKRHYFEHETEVEVYNMQAFDQKIGTNNGTKQRTIRGKNSDDHLERVKDLGSTM